MLRPRLALPRATRAAARSLPYTIHLTDSHPRFLSTGTKAPVASTRCLPLKAHALRSQDPRRKEIVRYLHSSSSRAAILPFKLPDIGEGIAEVEMLKWHVEVGQKVEHFDDLCEVQSDKSTAEISSPVDGTIRSIGFQAGQMVKVGQVLCEITTEEEGIESEPEQEDVPEKSGSSNVTADELNQDPVTQEGDNTPSSAIPSTSSQGGHETRQASLEAEGGHRTVGSEVHRSSEFRQTDLTDDPEVAAVLSDSETQTHFEPDAAAEYSGGARFSGEASILPSAPAPTFASGSAAVASGSVPRREAPSGRTERKIVLASPAVRATARRMEVDLEEVTGTGEKGRIRKEDIEAFVASRGDYTSSNEPGTSAQTHQPDQRSREDRDKVAEVTRVEFGRTRKVMWKALGAQGSVPHFGYSHTLDLTPLLPYMKALNPPKPSTSPSSPTYLASDIPGTLSLDPSPDPQPKTTLLTLLVKAMLMALEEHPIMRSKVMSKDDQRWLDIRRDPVIGVAVSDPKYGLVTPSLPPLVPSTSLSDITSHLSALRAKPTAPGPSSNLVISSVGGLGESTGAMPVIPPGGPIAICAVGRAKWEVEWALRDGGMKVDEREVERAGTRPVLRCPVGWSGDHRVLEGAELIAFTESWKRYVEEPWRWFR